MTRAPTLAVSTAFLLLSVALSVAPARAIQINGTFVAGPGPVTTSAVAAYAISDGQLTTFPLSFYVTTGSGAFTLSVPANAPILVVGNVVPFGSYGDPVLGGTHRLATTMRAT